jgi:hypothetical protein
MKSQTRPFLQQYLGVVMATLSPVIATAFVSMPLALGGHPGEVRSASVTTQSHMT